MTKQHGIHSSEAPGQQALTLAPLALLLPRSPAPTAPAPPGPPSCRPPAACCSSGTPALVEGLRQEEGVSSGSMKQCISMPACCRDCSTCTLPAETCAHVVAPEPCGCQPCTSAYSTAPHLELRDGQLAKGACRMHLLHLCGHCKPGQVCAWRGGCRCAGMLHACMIGATDGVHDSAPGTVSKCKTQANVIAALTCHHIHISCLGTRPRRRLCRRSDRSHHCCVRAARHGSGAGRLAARRGRLRRTWRLGRAGRCSRRGRP